MRKLQFDDTFLLSQIIEDLDIEVDLNRFLEDAKKHKENPEFVGGQFFLLLAKKWHKGKKSIPAFIASLSEKTEDEVRKMGLKETKDFFIDLFKQEDITDFFKSASDE